MIEKTLETLGLTASEIKIYKSLLSLHSVAASTLSRHTKTPRTTVKYGCEQLVKKGLAKRVNRNNCWYYSPCPPSRLQVLLDVQRKQLEEQAISLSSVIVELTEQYRKDETAPKVQFFEGAEGIIEMLNDVITDGSPIYGALELTDDMHPEVQKYIESHYIPQREATKSPAHMIFNDNPKTKAYRDKDLSMNRISMLAPREAFPFESCFHIYGDKVALYSYKSSMLTGVIIQETYIQKLLFSLFKMAWKLCQQMPENVRYQDINID